MGPSVGVGAGVAVGVGVGEKVAADGVSVAVGTGEPASATELMDRTFCEIVGTYRRPSRPPKTRTPIRIRGKIWM